LLIGILIWRSFLNHGLAFALLCVGFALVVVFRPRILDYASPRVMYATLTLWWVCAGVSASGVALTFFHRRGDRGDDFFWSTATIVIAVLFAISILINVGTYRRYADTRQPSPNSELR
jgi:hypothetical protein